ncbi:ABC transporter ATP-binding protein [Erysipelothrix rhusiopathiae]|nr:ABC transporter ATP-binding protein [Erysipelothrix rhusiopathiae]MDE8073404.1 ABC transporter ATP-binding protein [Erysipelothrix rhusiopathiae]MDE8075161.1 ABC transporter ATP-binding protein [Erysipelothrix rhusiopathiae]MDE8079377.1 ABC transporter ATP-binding protein [Erysipelothrix rhusiopathiae]MDE8085830.1 ABC transporter ATP-binding protein [Erysipelothrix rhusiopathiae]
MKLLETKNINYFYQDGDQRRFILRDVNTSFEAGTFYAVLGQSGSGKTTFLSLLSALDTPREGAVYYKDKNISEIGLAEYRRNQIGIIFQSYNLIPHLTAVENVLVAMNITTNQIPEETKEVAYNLLDFIGITRSKADRLVTMLSGGEQQRVAIARALSTNVDVILADEPTGNLDEEMEAEIINIFQHLAHDHQKCVIVVTHSQEIAKQADKILYLKKGSLEEISRGDLNE